MRDLSDILIEIAMQGLKGPEYGHSAVMHPLMMLAHVAWNQETDSADYMADRYETELSKFSIPNHRRRAELISDDWKVILVRMRQYKRLRFAEDQRIIRLCAFTPRSTLRVEWIPGPSQNIRTTAKSTPQRR